MGNVNREGHPDSLKVGIAQISPIWLNRDETISKVSRFIGIAGDQGCGLVTFGEALIPGYPFWIERTDGARFNSPVQKDLHAHYMQQAVQIDAGHFQPLCSAASKHRIAVYVGCVERASDRGGHSLYCSLVYIDSEGIIQSVHRKLMPTYEERLTWAPGDGHGLRVHRLGPFLAGGLNCWENWMPLARTALYALGEDLHVAAWPGGAHNTSDITRFIAREARSYVISACGIMRKLDVRSEMPHSDLILSGTEDVLANGGSCIAAPDGSWVIEPIVGEEGLSVGILDHKQVRAERQNFDAAGHYARPDVLRLTANRVRQSVLSIVEDSECE